MSVTHQNMPLRLVELRSLDEFLAAAADWDNLWLRSDVAAPTVRAELLAGWVEQFAPRQRFLALIVEENGRWVAGLALAGARLKRLVPVGRLTQNPWAQCGDLLLDPECDATAACRLLVEGLAAGPWPLLCLDDVPLEAPRWLRFRAALDALGVPALARCDYHVGQVEIPADWSALESHWSRNHRHKLRRIANKLERQGPVELQRYTHPDPAEVPALLRRAFELEARGWKGDGGTSVMSQPALFEYYSRIGIQLAAASELDLAFLSLGGQDIAFHCGSRAKGTTFGSKIGYDEKFAECSPGNALIDRLLRALHAEHGAWTHDFAGPLSDWTGRFATRRYSVGRLMVASRGVWGRLLLRVYAGWRPVQQDVVEENGDSHFASTAISDKIG
ncbi:MAG: GNAT family N-acetyltransferase [Pirellulales bacterium]